MYSRFHLVCQKEDIQSLFNDIDKRTLARKEYFSAISEYKTKVNRSIDSFILNDGVIDAKKMQSSWFANIDDYNRPHVFLSHKHRDLEYAEKFAAWLYKYFGIITFIDSFVWGNSYELQKFLDNQFCKNTDKSTYSYEKRNFSTAHVHMMLANALTMMIDQCECFIWLDLNNDDSFQSQIKLAVSGNESVTDSAWIYHEITTVQMLQRRPMDKHRLIPGMTSAEEKKLAMDSDSKLPHILYHPVTDKLKTLKYEDLIKWRDDLNNLRLNLYREHPEVKATSALNYLYKLKFVTDTKI